MTVEKTPDIVARPGDTLIIRLAGRLDDDEFEQLRQQWKPLADAGLHIFLADFVEGITIFRPGVDGLEKIGVEITRSGKTISWANGDRVQYDDMVGVIRDHRASARPLSDDYLFVPDEGAPGWVWGSDLTAEGAS